MSEAPQRTRVPFTPDESQSESGTWPFRRETPLSTILITGANRGIGLELARQYAVAGDRVLACCRMPEEAEALQALAADHAEVSVHGVRVAEGESVTVLAAELADLPIDVLINNAGAPGPGFAHQTVLNMDFDGWAETFAVNSMAPLRVLQALLPNLKLSGSAKAITITSQMGALSFDMPAAYAYCSSKAAVNKVMRLAALDLKAEGIAVGLIHPGWVQTDMGGPKAQITPEESAAGIVSAIKGIDLANTGCFLKWNGEAHEW